MDDSRDLGTEREHDTLAARARALQAVALTRAQGMHYWGHLLGLQLVPGAPGRTRLRMQPDLVGAVPGRAGDVVAPVALASLADLALSSAIRAGMTPGRRLGTTTLSVHHTVHRPHGVLEADAVAEWIDTDATQGLAHCAVRDTDDRLVATAQGWFFVLPVPQGMTLRPLPWEWPDPPIVDAVATEDLDDHERAAVAATEEAAMRARERCTTLAEELLHLVWADDGPEQVERDGRARSRLRLGPAITNRVGHVQGGALHGIAGLAAARVAGVDAVLADGHLQFLRPGDGSVLTAQAELLRRGRRATFVDVRLSVDERLVAAGQYAFRNPG